MLMIPVGNLSSDKVSKRDVFDIFHKYGRLAQISLKSAYGFVQYHTVEEGRNALEHLQGMEVKGRRIRKWLPNCPPSLATYLFLFPPVFMNTTSILTTGQIWKSPGSRISPRRKETVVRNGLEDARLAVEGKSSVTITDHRAITRLVATNTMVEQIGATGPMPTAATEDTTTRTETVAARDLPTGMPETTRTLTAGEAPAPTIGRGMSRSLIYRADTVQTFQTCKSLCSQTLTGTLALGSREPSRPKD
jgi:hypothetical protein